MGCGLRAGFWLEHGTVPYVPEVQRRAGFNAAVRRLEAPGNPTQDLFARAGIGDGCLTFAEAVHLIDVRLRDQPRDDFDVGVSRPCVRGVEAAVPIPRRRPIGQHVSVAEVLEAPAMDVVKRRAEIGSGLDRDTRIPVCGGRTNGEGQTGGRLRNRCRRSGTRPSCRSAP